MNPVKWAAVTTDRFFERAGVAVKALSGSLPFPYQTGGWYNILPRTSSRYGAGNESGMGSALIIGIVGWTMRNFVQAPIRLQSKRSVDGKTELDDIEPSDTGPGAFLSLLERPNEYYDGRLMQKAIVGDYETRGTAWVLKQRNGSDRVVALWWIPFALMRPMWPQDGSEWISYYEYNPNGIPYRVKTTDVICFRDGMDPDNPRLGFNKVARLAREIYTDDEAANFSATVLTNLGVPGVIISPKDTGIASRNRIEDPEGIKSSFMEKFTGDRRGEPLVLTSPTETQVMSWNPQQLTLKELRRIPEERASSVLGVPAIVANLGAGLDRSTFANFEEARAAAYEEKIIPLQGDFAPVWKEHLLSEFVGDVRQFEVGYDLSSVRVLAEDQNKLWERSLSALTKGGITRRRFKDLVGEETDDTDDVYYVPTTVSVESAEELPPEANVEPEVIPQVGPGDAMALLGPRRTAPETEAAQPKFVALATAPTVRSAPVRSARRANAATQARMGKAVRAHRQRVTEAGEARLSRQIAAEYFRSIEDQLAKKLAPFLAGAEFTTKDRTVIWLKVLEPDDFNIDRAVDWDKAEKDLGRIVGRNAVAIDEDVQAAIIGLFPEGVQFELHRTGLLGASTPTLQEALRRWITPGEDYPVRQAFEQMQRGKQVTGQVASDAVLLAEALHRAERITQTIYRGEQLAEVPKVGEVVRRPISAWGNHATAEGYAFDPAGAAVHGVPISGEPVVFKMFGAKAVQTPELDEWLSGGVLEVVRRRKVGDIWEVEVHQARTYDPPPMPGGAPGGITSDFQFGGGLDKNTLAQIGDRVKRINSETQERLRKTVSTGLAEGLSPQQLAKNLIGQVGSWRGKDGTIAHSRAMVIARTETGIVYNRSSVLRSAQTGLVDSMICLDNPDCGWIGHDDGRKPNGTAVSFDDAIEHPLSHPNCVRAYAPNVEGLGVPEPRRSQTTEAQAEQPTRSLLDEADEAEDAYRDKIANPGSPGGNEALHKFEESWKRYVASIEDAGQATRLLSDLSDQIRNAADAGEWHEIGIIGRKLSLLKGKEFDLRMALPFEERVAAGQVTSDPHGFGMAKPMVERFHSELLAVGPRIEAELGMKTRWNGNLRYERMEGNAAAYTHEDGHLMAVGPDTVRYNDAGRHLVEIHELLHTVSDRTFSGTTSSHYAAWAGWEEGVVELMAQHLQPKFHAGEVGYKPYAAYTTPIKKMANAVAARNSGTSYEKILKALFELPVQDREAYMKGLIKATPGLTLKQFDSDLKVLKGSNSVAT